MGSIKPTISPANRTNRPATPSSTLQGRRRPPCAGRIGSFTTPWSRGGAEGWMKPTLKYTWSAIQNIKRDPFEQAAGWSDQKTAVSFFGAPGGSTTAVAYDFSIVPLGQQLWLKELESFQQFPPLQAPETYNLDQVLAAIKSMKHGSPSGE